MDRHLAQLLIRRPGGLLLLLAALACGGDPSGPSTSNSSRTGALGVTILGLPSGTSADVTVSGPEGFTQSLTATGTLINLVPGTYHIAAQDVFAAGGTLYTASPPEQDASVTAQATTSATVTYSPPSSGELNLRIDGMYLTQSTQTYSGAVPLVQNRDGYLRVFVVANRTNLGTPVVRVRFYQNLLLQSEVSIPAPGPSVPTAVDESSLSYSWNIPVQGSLIQPGLSILAEVDTENAVVESNESDNAFPSGAALSLDVRAIPTLGVTFVRVVQSNGSKGSVSDASKHDFLATLTKMHPVAGYNAVVHAAYTTTTADTLEDDNGNGAWVTILREIDLLRTAEGGAGYYYGIARVSYTSGIAGVAYVSDPAIGAKGRAALGWDYLPGGSVVLAHELGHNWGREHAPCGNPANPDPDYPYAGGIIGVYGLDVGEQSLKAPSSSDIMGSCDSKWISDYSYTAMMNYLGSSGALVMGASSEPQSSLLVWGEIEDGSIRLEPAFQVITRPSLPRRGGPYTVEARAQDGSRVFALSFSPGRIADAPGTRQSFVFAVPIRETEAARISTLRVTGPAGETQRRAGPSGVPSDLQLQLGARGGVRLRWNAAAYPLILVRDAATREVLSLARGGRAELSTTASALELVASDGVQSRVHRVSLR